MAIQPRNKSQARHAKDIAKSGSGSTHLVADSTGAIKEQTALQLEQAGIPIILNPFFTKLWPQHPTNMTNCPYTRIFTNECASWRHMQLTSPPTLEVSMSVWYTNPSGKGNQLRPTTGRVDTGVTLGHLANLLASLPSKLERHWMSIDSHAWWARSADTIVVEAGMDDHDGKNAALKGVYVNPSNGIAFPGAF